MHGVRHERFLIGLVLLLTSVGAAEEPPKGIEPFNEFHAQPLEGWDWEKDGRLDDLIQQLRQKEVTLQAIDAQIAKAERKKSGANASERMAWRSNQRMDYQGGGPVRWDAFYGRNAENFFYHPVDPNTTYHTQTLLRQTIPSGDSGVVGNQGTPTHQRPPQFDYIYRGYEQAQARAKAQASELANKLAEMKDRRRLLEDDVVLLWVKIAFRTIDRDKIPEKAVLRWTVVPANTGDKDGLDRATALTEAGQFLATALVFNEALVESDAEKAFRTVGPAVKKQRLKFEDSLLRLASVSDEADDRTTPIGQYKLLARRLEDTSKSLTEGYDGWKEGDGADDEHTKYNGLRRVQDSTVNYSKILLALDELIGVMKQEWGMRVVAEGQPFVPSWDVTYEPGRLPTATPTPSPSARSPTEDDARHLALGWLARHQMPDGSWSFNHAQCPECASKCSHPGRAEYDQSGATGLVLLAFYGAGHTHREGDYRAALHKGLEYLAVRCMQGNGKLYDGRKGPAHGRSYCQGIGALALATCYGLTADKKIQQPAQFALNAIQDAQDPDGGGWRYEPKQRGDTCVTAWQVSALVAGQKAKLLVDPRVLQAANRFLDQMQADGGSQYGYQDGGRCNPGTSAMGLYCRSLLGFGWTPTSPAYVQGLGNLLQLNPDGDIYRDYYVTKVMATAPAQQRLTWSEPMKRRLIAWQTKEDHETGSWWAGFEDGQAAPTGGRLLITALAVMILNACP